MLTLVPMNPHRAARWLLTVAALLLVASQASATSLGFGLGIGLGGHGHPGGAASLSLGDLVEGGGSFTSLDGSLEFSNFDALASGLARDDLDLYRIIPTAHGFDLFAPVFSLFGQPGDLALDYDVTAAQGLLIEDIDLSVAGVALFGKAGVDLTALDESGGVAAELAARAGGPGKWHGDAFSGSGGFHPSYPLPPALDVPLANLSVEEQVFADANLFGKVLHVKHRYGIVPVPEPGTALLLGMGLAGIAARRSSR